MSASTSIVKGRTEPDQDEWVVRASSCNGITVSLCGCPGEEEARAVAACVEFVLTACTEQMLDSSKLNAAIKKLRGVMP